MMFNVLAGAIVPPYSSVPRTARAWVLRIAVGVACAAFACPGGAVDSVPERPAVEVATVSVQAVSVDSWTPGSIVSRDDARIASIVSGQVVWVADVGALVRQGETIAKVDDTLPRLRVEELRAQVARARAQHEVSGSQLDRFNRLAATQALSASQLEDARAQRDMSGDDLARVESQLRQAQYEIGQSLIRAPFPGVVTERFVQRGEYLQIGAATVRLVNTVDIEARATAALDLAAHVHPGQMVIVRERGIEKRGRVRTVVPVGDDRSRQFEVRVTLASPEWLVGTPIEVSLPTTAARTAVTVPRDALMIRQNHSYVLRVTRANTVEQLDVTPGAGMADAVEVSGPLSPGDRLVVRGGERLAAGQVVRVVSSATHAAQAHPG
jgi:RND family efflux transporter MFP subunit